VSPVRHARGGPRLTFACELGPRGLRELLADGRTVGALRRLDARVALALPELDDDRAAVVRQLGDAGVPVVAIPLLALEQGVFLNLDDVDAAARRVDELLGWTREHALVWDAVALDLEPPAELLRRVFLDGEGRAVLREVLPRARDRQRLERGTDAYRRMAGRLRGQGLRVESYQFPFLVDDRRAATTLVHRLLGVPVLRTEQDTLMLYTSFQGRLGPAVLAGYGTDAEAIAVGSTGGGEEGGPSVPVLGWGALARDLRLAARFTDAITIHSLEGCVAQGMLGRLEALDWDAPAPVPPAASAVRAARWLARVALRALERSGRDASPPVDPPSGAR
jgi:hypothetical protein